MSKKDDDAEKTVEKELAPEPLPPPPVPQGDNMIDKLNLAVDRQEAANKVTSDLLRRQEEIKVQDVLGGSADAGGPPALSADDKATLEAKKMLEGTGFEDIFDDVPDKKV